MLNTTYPTSGRSAGTRPVITGHTFSIHASPEASDAPEPSPRREFTAEEREEIAYRLTRSHIDELNRTSMFLNKEANEWSYEASLKPDPVSLWGDGLWFQNEVACLFADTNIGKSILAVQIASDIAEAGVRVLYFDFEMSAKQFQMRYRDEATGARREFSRNFRRLEMNPDVSQSRDIVRIAADIRSQAEVSKASAIIIDNISWICNEAENGEAAGELMQTLVKMKREMGLSILVLAHTPKRLPGTPLTVNCLAGSKKLSNFMDSIFAIGRDMTALPHGRYLKQIKVRSAPLTYHDSNVLRFSIGKCDGMLQFFPEEGTAAEADLIGDTQANRSQRSSRISGHEEQINAMRSEGRTLREISAATGISKSALGRYFGQD